MEVNNAHSELDIRHQVLESDEEQTAFHQGQLCKSPRCHVAPLDRDQNTKYSTRQVQSNSGDISPRVCSLVMAVILKNPEGKMAPDIC